MHAIFARMWVMLYNADVDVEFDASEREVLVKYLTWRVDSLAGAYLAEADPGIVRLVIPTFAPDWPLSMTLELAGHIVIPHCPVAGLSETLVMLGCHTYDRATATLYRHMDIQHAYGQEDLNKLAQMLIRQWCRRLMPWTSRYGYW